MMKYMAGIACPQCWLPVASLHIEKPNACKCPNRAELWAGYSPDDVDRVLALPEDIKWNSGIVKGGVG